MGGVYGGYMEIRSGPEAQRAIDEVHRKYIASDPVKKDQGLELAWDATIGGKEKEKPLTLSDEEVIKKASTAANGKKFQALWDGNIGGYPSQSEADQALCNILSFFCRNDKGQVDRLFRQSGLMRPKWDEKHGAQTYGEMTIAKAVRDNKNVYQGSISPEKAFKANGQEQKQDKYKLIKAADVPYAPPRWLAKPYFQLGKGTLIQADNGTGKTAFMCAVAAHVSTGLPWLGIPILTPGNVLILSVEDELSTLRGRIEASSGNLNKCYFKSNAAGLTFNSPEVEQMIKEIEAKLVIFDPFQAFLGAGIDMHRANETRPELAKLFEMADRNSCSVAIIAHLAKNNTNRSFVNQALGSVDVPAAMRSIFHLTRNPEDETECIAIHVKCSNAPIGKSIAFTIGDFGGVHWKRFDNMTAEDLNIMMNRKEKDVRYEDEPMVEVIKQLIADKPGGGFWAYEEVKTMGAKVLGYTPFSEAKDLKKTLDGLYRELKKRDGLIVTHGHKSGDYRGIRIEQISKKMYPQGGGKR